MCVCVLRTHAPVHEYARVLDKRGREGVIVLGIFPPGTQVLSLPCVGSGGRPPLAETDKRLKKI